jgi:uncharacterized protein YlxW (UPF0749 family)
VSRRAIGLALVALVALAVGFVLADQVRTQLLTPSNQVARYQALVRSVQELEATNAGDRSQIAELRNQIATLEAAAAARSATTQALQNQVADLRGHAGLIAVHGPGVEVVLRNGVAGSGAGGVSGYLVNFQDVQDVVNLLFAEGAEAIAVNGRRLTPLSSFSGSGGEIVVDQGPPITSPVKVDAIGDRNRMEAALDDSSALPDIRARQVQFDLHLTFEGLPDISLPAYDSSLQAPHVSAA